MKRLQIGNKILLFSAIPGIVLFLASVYVYMPRLVAEVKNPVVLWAQSGEASPLPWERFPNTEFLRVAVNDSITLAAYRTAARGPVKGTVLALHGYRSSGARFLPAARWFTAHGWDFIAVDLRGHGRSTGRFSGFSYYERQDIDRLIDSLARYGRLRGPLVLYGHSIGAATAVFTAERNPRVRALVLESCFDDFSRLVPNYWHYYVSDRVDMPHYWVDDLLERLHLPPDSLRPLDVAPQIRVPVLQIQGLADRKVKASQARRLFRAFGSERKEWIGIPQGTHNRLWLSDTAAYFRRINAFLTRALTNAPTPDAGI